MSTSVNFSCIRETILKLSVLLLDFLSTSVNLLCICGTFRQLFVHPRDLTFLFIHGIFRQLLSTFMRRVTFHQLLPTFHVSTGPSINFPYVRGLSINFPGGRRTFRQLLSTFCAFVGPFAQLSVWQRERPSTFCASAGPSINCREYFVRPQKLPEIFHASARPSVNFRQL